MSRNESATKKRRLESEVSQASGITYLSNVTQTTELSSDLDDNNSDSSSAAIQTEIIYNRRQSATNGPTIKQMNNPRVVRAKSQFIRKRGVSWSLDDDDDETFENDTRDKENNPVQHWVRVPYDNNFSGTNNSRRRIRRATESSLDTNAFSFNKQQPFSGVGEQQNTFQKLRSNTSSQIYGHEQEIQRRQIDELIRMHDAQVLQNRRSHSVTSLRNDRLHSQSSGHLYEPLQSQNIAQKMIINDRPVETVVSLTPSNSNYLHPVTETKVQGKESASGFSNDGCSAYADVIHHKENSTGKQSQKTSFDFCDNSFYRRGFYILLVFNVILVLLNSFGLLFVYFAVKHEEILPDEGVTSSSRQEICLDVGNIHEKVKQELCADLNTDDKTCCFQSSEEVLPKFLKIFDELARVPPTEKSANTPAIQVKAEDKRKVGNEIRIVWESRADINTLEAEKNDSIIIVPKTGYYYVYSRVHYKKPSDKGKGKHNGFTIGHTIKKIEKKAENGDEGKRLDTVVQSCFPSNTTDDVIHTNQLESLHHLNEGERLYVILHQTQYVVYEETLFGMFMVAT